MLPILEYISSIFPSICAYAQRYLHFVSIFNAAFHIEEHSSFLSSVCALLPTLLQFLCLMGRIGFAHCPSFLRTLVVLLLGCKVAAEDCI